MQASGGSNPSLSAKHWAYEPRRKIGVRMLFLARLLRNAHLRNCPRNFSFSHRLWHYSRKTSLKNSHRIRKIPLTPYLRASICEFHISPFLRNDHYVFPFPMLCGPLKGRSTFHFHNRNYFFITHRRATFPSHGRRIIFMIEKETGPTFPFPFSSEFWLLRRARTPRSRSNRKQSVNWESSRVWFTILTFHHCLT